MSVQEQPASESSEDDDGGWQAVRPQRSKSLLPNIAPELLTACTLKQC